MKPYRTLSSLLLASTIFLALGGLILRLENLVPFTLTASTIAVILVIFLVAHFVCREKFLWTVAGLILALVSIIFNTTQPQHVDAILHPFVSVQFTVLVISDVMGFYILPAAYIALYAIYFRRLKK